MCNFPSRETQIKDSCVRRTCDFRATRRRNNTVASEYILGEKIRLGIEITCLAAVRYRFNSITCFLFIHRFRSHGCSFALASVGLVFFFHPDLIRARYRVTRSSPWPWKFLCFTRTGITAVHASFRWQRPRLSPVSSMELARGKEEIFESRVFFMTRMQSRYPSEWANRVSSLLNHGAAWCIGRIGRASSDMKIYIIRDTQLEFICTDLIQYRWFESRRNNLHFPYYKMIYRWTNI